MIFFKYSGHVRKCGETPKQFVDTKGTFEMCLAAAALFKKKSARFGKEKETVAV